MCIESLVSVRELFPVLYICSKGRTKLFCKIGWVEFLNFLTDCFFLFFNLLCTVDL